MSAFKRGKDYELKIQKITAKKLHLEVKRDSRSGGGQSHKADIRDRYNELPIFIECKDQEKLNLKEWWRDADAKSSFGQAPIVVFPHETNAGLEDLAVMRYTDLLQLIREMMDWKETAEDYRTDDTIKPSPKTTADRPKTDKPDPVKEAERFANQAKAKREEKTNTCRAGHLADTYGFCFQKDCKYSRSYKPKKKKKKKR